MFINYDCRHFRGDLPCKFKLLCKGCKKYDPVRSRILIIKFAAIGDVLRTTPLLPAIKKRYKRSLIHWLCEEGCQEVLLSNKLIDKVFTFGPKTALCLARTKYDLVINLDKDPGALAVSMSVNADVKKGFGLTEYGKVTVFNKGSEYAYLTGIDDELKFKTNQKTYQQIMYECADIPYENHGYMLSLSRDQRIVSRELIRKTSTRSKIRIGLNTGCGDIFPLKKWKAEYYVRLIDMLAQNDKFALFLLGGPVEEQRNSRILSKSGDKVVDTGNQNTLHDFIGIVNACDIIITSDTVAMHFGIGLSKYVIALMGPTSRSEIDLYGNGRIISSGIDCAPCTHAVCKRKPSCMDAISADDVYKAVLFAAKGIKR